MGVLIYTSDRVQISSFVDMEYTGSEQISIEINVQKPLEMLETIVSITEEQLVIETSEYSIRRIHNQGLSEHLQFCRSGRRVYGQWSPREMVSSLPVGVD